MGSIKGLFLFGTSYLFIIENYEGKEEITEVEGKGPSRGDAHLDERKHKFLNVKSEIHEVRGKSYGSLASLTTCIRNIIIHLSYFVLATSSVIHNVRSWAYDSVNANNRMRYLLREVSIELFFADGQSLLIALPTSLIMEEVKAFLSADLLL